MPSLHQVADKSVPATGAFATSPSLLERARGNDADAWKRIVHLYGPLVDHWCRRASLSRDDSDEVVQDIFLSVTKQLTQFRRDRPNDTFRGWLRVIAQRRIADYFRGIADQPLATGGTTAFRRINESPDPFVDDPDAESEEASVTQRALEFIRPEFEPRTWLAFRRTAIEGKTPADIAVELQMSPSAIRMAKSRVLNRLRQELDGLGPAWQV